MTRQTKEFKKVPYLIEEKEEVFWPSVVLTRQIIGQLKTGYSTYNSVQSLYECLGKYPIGLPVGILKESERKLMIADSLVLRAWALSMEGKCKSLILWEGVRDLLLEACNLVRCVYAEEGERKVAITRKYGTNESRSVIHKERAMQRIEPNRLTSLYIIKTKS